MTRPADFQNRKSWIEKLFYFLNFKTEKIDAQIPPIRDY